VTVRLWRAQLCLGRARYCRHSAGCICWPNKGTKWCAPHKKPVWSVCVRTQCVHASMTINSVGEDARLVVVEVCGQCQCPLPLHSMPCPANLIGIDARATEHNESEK